MCIRDRGSAYVLKTYVIACVIWPLAFVLPSGFRGAGDAMYPLVTAIGTMWLLRVMLGYYLGVTLHLGVLGIFIGMYADWVARVVIYARRFVKEGWLKLMRRRKEQEAQTVSGRT